MNDLHFNMLVNASSLRSSPPLRSGHIISEYAVSFAHPNATPCLYLTILLPIVDERRGASHTRKRYLPFPE